MKSAFLLFAAFLAASPAFAQSKIASVDMETIVLSHPKAEENRLQLEKSKADFEARLGTKRDAAKKIAVDLESKFKDVENPVISDERREAIRSEAIAMEKRFRDAEFELRKEVAELQDKLRKEELKLFEAAMVDITNAVAKVAAAGKYDYVLDNSAMRSGAPVPLVVFSDKAHDITDNVIIQLGGKRVDKNAKREEEEKQFQNR